MCPPDKELGRNVMDAIQETIRREKSPSIALAEDLLEAMRKFQDQLPPGDEMIVSIPALPPGAAVADIRRLGANLLVFQGSLLDGRPFVVMQHCSQVSVCFMASPKTADQPRRIGFGS